MTPTLLPCPFCGNDKASLVNSTRHDYYWVVCSPYRGNGCGAESRTAETPAEAIARWNRRAGEAELEQQLEDMRTVRVQLYAERDAPREALAVAERNIELSRESWLRTKDERDALRRALGRYGEHDPGCDSNDGRQCACGFLQALRGKP